MTASRDCASPTRLSAVITGILGVLLGVVAMTAGQTGPQGKAVTNIRLEADGPLNRVAPQDLGRLISQRAGEPYDASQIRRSIERLYATQAFHDIQVKTRPVESDGVEVVFQLYRRYLVHKVEFLGDVRLGQVDLRREFTLRAGMAFSDERMREGLDRLSEFYRSEGFYRAQIEPQYRLDLEHARLTIDLRIEAGEQALLDALTIENRGTDGTQEYRRRLDLPQGSAYSRRQLEGRLKEVQNSLALRGYLQTQAEIVDEDYLAETNQVRVKVLIDSGPGPQVEFQGIDLSDRELLGLPIFTFGSTSPGLAEETAEEVKRLHQEKGYFLAQVSVEGQSPDEVGEKTVFKVDKGLRRNLKEISFEGCSQLDCDRLRNLLQAKTAGFFSRGQLTDRIAQRDQQAVRNFYRDRGFRDAKADYRLEEFDAGLKLVYSIDEGERTSVGKVEVVGNREISDEVLRALIQTAPGAPFSPFRVAEDRTRLIAGYADRGYGEAECRIEATFPAPRQVDVTFRIEEGRRTFVGEVVVVGDLQTKPQVIRREIRLKQGDPYSLRNRLLTETNLHNLSVFSRVQVEGVEDSQTPRSETVVISLEEAPQYAFLYGIGFSSFEGVRGTIGISDSNFGGRAQRLAASLRASEIRQRAALSLTTPRLGAYRLPTVFSLTARNENIRTTRDGSTRNIDGRPFDELRFTAEARTERILSRRESLFFGLRYERIDVTPPPDLETTLEFFRVEERLKLSTLTFSYINESRDLSVDPKRGFFLSGDTALSSRFVGSEEEFFRIVSQGQYYKPLKAAVVFASAVRLGWIKPFGRTDINGLDNPVPISERFFSGGSTSLRGLPQDLAGPLLTDPETGEVILVNNDGQLDPNGRPVPLGGNALLIGNFELRRPIWRFLSGTVFYDVGNVFRSFSSASFSDLTHTVGVGLRLRTPIGPFRFDAGYNPDPPLVRGFDRWNFHITLGHAF